MAMFSFVIPTYSRVDCLFKCVDSLKRVEPNLHRYRIVVVHDCGPAEARNKIIQRFRKDPTITLILKDKRGGFSKAVNCGIRAALPSAQFIILTNDDVQFTKPVIDWYQAAFSEDTRIGLVGAKLLFPNKTIQHVGVNWVNGKYKYGMAPSFHHMHYHRPSNIPEANIARDCVVTGALMGLRSTMVQTIGMLDEQYCMGYEDVDYCLTAMGKGWRCVYRPTITAIHDEGSSRGIGIQNYKKDPFTMRGYTIGTERLHTKIREGVLPLPPRW